MDREGTGIGSKLSVVAMPPKKKATKKKKAKEDNNEDGGIMTPQMQAKMFASANQSLVVQLADRTEQAKLAIAQKRELQGRVEELMDDFKSEQSTTLEITQDMTRQYKGMQEELLNRVNSLENRITDLKDQLEDSRQKLEETKAEKDQQIAMKDAEIADMKAKMEEMAHEFGDMLKKTLEKMSERIEVTSTAFENETGVPIIRQLEEFNLASAYQQNGDM